MYKFMTCSFHFHVYIAISGSWSVLFTDQLLLILSSTILCILLQPEITQKNSFVFNHSFLKSSVVHFKYFNIYICTCGGWVTIVS